jgi:D-3-phosphoglycerate dehydrogenase
MLPRIGVTSVSFSKNQTLRAELLSVFPESCFNDSGKMSEADVISFLARCDAAIIGTEPVTGRVIESLPGIGMYAKYGVGLDNIDLEVLATRGIPLGWTGGVNRRSVSELALWFMLSLCRNTVHTSRQLASGIWDKDGGRLLSGLTVGIVGCGFVGEDLLSLLSAFGGQRLIVDIEDRSGVALRFGARQVSYLEALSSADILSFHVPLTEATRGILNSKKITQLTPDTIIINTSRGSVFDEAALKEALRSGRIQAGLDVYSTEPPTDLELLAQKGLVCTPHVGGNAREAVLAMGRSAISHLVHHFGQKKPSD